MKNYFCVSEGAENLPQYCYILKYAHHPALLTQTVLSCSSLLHQQLNKIRPDSNNRIAIFMKK